MIAGHDPRDSTSVDRARAALYARRSSSRWTGLRLGLVREHFGEGLDAEVEAAVREAVDVYESLGATVNEVSLPHSKYAVATYYIIAPCEASSNLARYDGVTTAIAPTRSRWSPNWTPSASSCEAAGDTAAADDLDNATGAHVSPARGPKASAPR